MMHHSSSAPMNYQQPPIHTINVPMPPPSYAEATCPAAKIPAASYGQPTVLDHQDCSSNYPSVAPECHHYPDFYPDVSAQPPYPPYPSSAAEPMSQQYRPAIIIQPIKLEDRCCCCSRSQCISIHKKMIIVFLTMMIVITMIKVILVLTL